MRWQIDNEARSTELAITMSYRYDKSIYPAYIYCYTVIRLTSLRQLSYFCDSDILCLEFKHCNSNNDIAYIQCFTSRERHTKFNEKYIFFTLSS